ncbi:hypothetical protein Ais01nite_15230 [Asanoa ishikariensis]|nr:hypothetical protein Ais01nite_15230 [Asanoa ishikariensis]
MSWYGSTIEVLPNVSAGDRDSLSELAVNRFKEPPMSRLTAVQVAAIPILHAREPVVAERTRA